MKLRTLLYLHACIGLLREAIAATEELGDVPSVNKLCFLIEDAESYARGIAAREEDWQDA